MPRERNGQFGRSGFHHDNVAGGDPTKFGFSYKRKKKDPKWPISFFCIGRHKKEEELNGSNGSRMPYLCHQCAGKMVIQEVPVDARKRKGLFAVAQNRNGIIGVLDPDGENKMLRQLRLVKSFTNRNALPVKFLKREEGQIINRLRKTIFPPV